MDDNYRKIKSIKDISEVFINLFPIFFRRKNSIGIFSMCFYRILKEDKGIYKKYAKLNNDLFEIKTLFKNKLGIKKGKYIYYFNIYKVSIDVDKVKSYPPQNLFHIVFKNKNNEIEFPVVYNAIYYKNYLGKVGVLKKIDDNLICYFRQTKMNSIALTVRKNNITDKFIERVKIFFAKLLSLVTPKSNIILLYDYILGFL